MRLPQPGQLWRVKRSNTTCVPGWDADTNDGCGIPSGHTRLTNGASAGPSDNLRRLQEKADLCPHHGCRVGSRRSPKGAARPGSTTRTPYRRHTAGTSVSHPERGDAAVSSDIAGIESMRD